MIDAHLSRLQSLIGQGRQLQGRLEADAADPLAPELVRLWQRECATMINELSGGTKAHWLARAFSNAFLIRSTSGLAVEDAPIAGIVVRIVDVLAQATRSLVSMGAASEGTDPNAAPTPRRFDFVHDAALRPILEAAYLDSRRALEQGRFETALITSCGLLEAVVTDALTQADRNVLTAHGAPEGPIANWPFEARIAAAERVGLIRGGCARLPPIAKRYRDLAGVDGEFRPGVSTSEREARLAGQVLHVIMRDLDPRR